MTSRFQFQSGHICHLSNDMGQGPHTEGNAVDQWSNVWLCTNGHLKAITPAGVVLQDYSWSTIVTAICTFALAHQAPSTNWTSTADHIADHGHGVHLVTSGGITYLIFHVNKTNAADSAWQTTVAVFQLAQDGTYTIKGVAWGNMFGVTAFQVVATHKIDLAGSKTLDDPILLGLGINDDGRGPCFKAFPSINQIIAHVASGVTHTRYLWPAAWFNPGDEYHGLGMGDAFGVNAKFDQSLFFMPNASGGTDILIYYSPTQIGVTDCPHVVSNFQGSYPNGCLLKATIPTTSYAFTTGTPTQTDANLSAPTVVTGAFNYDGAAHDSLQDANYWFDGSSGAVNWAEYFPVPRVIEATGDGFLVGWYQPWFKDTSYDGGTNWTFKERLRLMTYSAATGVFSDAGLLEGATIHVDDIGANTGAPLDFFDINGFSILRDGNFLEIWHFHGSSAAGAARYVTWLGYIGLAVIGQVTVHTRIGAARAA